MPNKDYISLLNINKKTSEWLSVVNSAVKPRPQFVFNPKSSALLVIDIINHFTDPTGRAYMPSGHAMLPNINSVNKSYNDLSLPIILSRHYNKSNDGTDMMQKFYSDHIKDGEFDSLLSDKLELSGKEIIINKNTYDAFWNTDLEKILKEKNITQVLISGCLTHLCCETTARSAFVRGFEVYFGADLTFSKTEELHLASLISIADGFGKILSTKEIKECLK